MTNAVAAEEFHRFAEATEFRRDTQIPLWVQLKNLLEQKIRDGSLTENARLPSELAMARMFNLSRPVVRNALSALVSEGLIAKQARKGIFVSARRGDFDFMTSATGVFDDLSAKGMDVEERTFEFGLFEPDEEEAKALRLPVGFKVLRFVRVYVADGSPITHSRISLPAHRLPGMENFDMKSKSIFGTIRERFGLTVARADRWIKGGFADATLAERLEVEEGHPLLYIQSIAYDAEQLPLEFYRSYYNAEVSPIHISVDANR
ncbi:GntR family transcriptional regulator [Hoeflea prorocentri]|uniref:GntR family transcriptional regulator n=1 Tax=Hoeflea prorocentri TaxID=1922333 RepID=A0A9X3UIN7_9HYPH|nr:GntR family transcriptional regulator [Hoeflea prorocentri]MCY6381548.1 GntR family transcriptional regulator [Hoeflea prorocentri]MDA5399348.1 GntR family transcriptional regulator [Hoeflea prorocentri]